MPATAKVWCMKQQFVGAPKHEDFVVKEEGLPALEDGDVLAEAVVWSVDPYNRAYSRGMPDGAPMIGFQVAKITETKNPDVPVGSIVLCHAGWRTHTVLKKDAAQMFGYNVLPKKLTDSFPLTYFVGVLGMPGATAYFGVREKLRPVKGETLVVNAGSGAVGTVVGQLGKIYGLNVIGYAGSEEKVQIMKGFGFDHAFNYKTQDLAETLKQGAPNGVDCFFDNVGYEFALTVFAQMNPKGRICQCGAIAGYNLTEPKQIVFPYMEIIGKGLVLSGLHVSQHWGSFEQFITEMSGYVATKQVQVKETKYSGFDKMPQALMDVLSGATEGKAVIEP